MKVIARISNRHIHITKEDYMEIFNKSELTKRNDLTQPGQFAANETVTIKTNKNKIENVRIVGPFRTYTQFELSKTDARALGINPPVRNNGDLDDAEIVTIIGPEKEIEKKCAIIADRHIHITPEEKETLGITKNIVKVSVNTKKGTILDNVLIRTDDKFKFELHIDTDDGNACLLENGTEVEIIDYN